MSFHKNIKDIEKNLDFFNPNVNHLSIIVLAFAFFTVHGLVRGSKQPNANAFINFPVYI